MSLKAGEGVESRAALFKGPGAARVGCSPRPEDPKGRNPIRVGLPRATPLLFADKATFGPSGHLLLTGEDNFGCLLPFLYFINAGGGPPVMALSSSSRLLETLHWVKRRPPR